MHVSGWSQTTDPQVFWSSPYETRLSAMSGSSRIDSPVPGFAITIWKARVWGKLAERSGYMDNEKTRRLEIRRRGHRRGCQLGQGKPLPMHATHTIAHPPAALHDARRLQLLHFTPEVQLAVHGTHPLLVAVLCNSNLARSHLFWCFNSTPTTDIECRRTFADVLSPARRPASALPRRRYRFRLWPISSIRLGSSRLALLTAAPTPRGIGTVFPPHRVLRWSRIADNVSRAAEGATPPLRPFTRRRSFLRRCVRARWAAEASTRYARRARTSHVVLGTTCAPPALLVDPGRRRERIAPARRLSRAAVTLVSASPAPARGMLPPPAHPPAQKLLFTAAVDTRRAGELRQRGMTLLHAHLRARKLSSTAAVVRVVREGAAAPDVLPCRTPARAVMVFHRRGGTCRARGGRSARFPALPHPRARCNGVPPPWPMRVPRGAAGWRDTNTRRSRCAMCVPVVWWWGVGNEAGKGGTRGKGWTGRAEEPAAAHPARAAPSRPSSTIRTPGARRWGAGSKGGRLEERSGSAVPRSTRTMRMPLGRWYEVEDEGGAGRAEEIPTAHRAGTAIIRHPSVGARCAHSRPASCVQRVRRRARADTSARLSLDVRRLFLDARAPALGSLPRQEAFSQRTLRSEPNALDKNPPEKKQNRIQEITRPRVESCRRRWV
ncbi:hypothetical protein C8R47DRAFT_1286201 [Mycena vitilis]|nr:hypothetical protein C8R47DRAFT_1286201 [Mycena vitilis]